MLLFASLTKRNDDDDALDTELVDRIKNGDSQAFEDLFFRYHSHLNSFAISITKSRELARDGVQDVFFRIWRNRKEWNIHTSLRVYLFQAVKNQCLNLIEKQNNQLKLRENFRIEHVNTLEVEFNPDSKITPKQQELIKEIWKVVDRMPERRRMVFYLHRKNGFKYKEIAKIMSISKKTVENQIGQALKFIRSEIDMKKFE